MKYGIYYSYWEKAWRADYISYIKKAKNLGFDILEVGCHHFIDMEDEYLLRLKDEAEQEEVVLTGGYGPDAQHDIASEDASIVKAAFEKYEATFKKMKVAGVKKLGGGLYSYWPVDYSKPIRKEEDRASGIANIRELADVAASYEITLGMEVLNRFEGYILNTCEEAVAFVDEVDRPNIKIMLDTFHMNIEEDSFGDAIRLAGSRLGHVHLGEANRRPPFAGGRIPWNEIGEALHDIHYEGDVVMEPFVRMGGEVGNDIRIWHDLSNGCSDEKLDADAAASVAFLRDLWG